MAKGLLRMLQKQAARGGRPREREDLPNGRSRGVGHGSTRQPSRRRVGMKEAASPLHRLPVSNASITSLPRWLRRIGSLFPARQAIGYDLYLAIVVAVYVAGVEVQEAGVGCESCPGLPAHSGCCSFGFLPRRMQKLVAASQVQMRRHRQRAVRAMASGGAEE